MINTETSKVEIWAPWAINKEGDSCDRSKLDRLRGEIVEFVSWVSPTLEETSMRKDVISRITRHMKSLWPEAKLITIGSYESNLLLPFSDIDVVIIGASKDHNNLNTLFRLASMLEEGWYEVITTAKVPIIKYRDAKSQINIDIAFEVQSGKENTKIVQKFIEEYPLLKALTLVIKFFLKNKYLNDTWKGGVGSYSLIIMIIGFLQMSAKDAIDVNDKNNLASLLIGFFQFYGVKFNYIEKGISVKNGGTIYDKKSRGWFSETHPDLLSVEDPHNPDIDVGSASFGIEEVKKSFKEAYEKWELFELSETTHANYLQNLFDSEYVLNTVGYREYIKFHYHEERKNFNKHHKKKVMRKPRNEIQKKSLDETVKNMGQSTKKNSLDNDFPSLTESISTSPSKKKNISNLYQPMQIKDPIMTQIENINSTQKNNSKPYNKYKKGKKQYPYKPTSFDRINNLNFHQTPPTPAAWEKNNLYFQDSTNLIADIPSETPGELRTSHSLDEVIGESSFLERQFMNKRDPKKNRTQRIFIEEKASSDQRKM